MNTHPIGNQGMQRPVAREQKIPSVIEKIAEKSIPKETQTSSVRLTSRNLRQIILLGAASQIPGAAAMNFDPIQIKILATTATLITVIVAFFVVFCCPPCRRFAFEQYPIVFGRGAVPAVPLDGYQGNVQQENAPEAEDLV